MLSVKNIQYNPSPEIEFSEIDIPDDNNLSTGQFRIKVKASSTSEMRIISSAIVNIPVFQISVNRDLNKKAIPILLGKADGSLQKINIGSFDQFVKPVKDKILNSLSHPTQFDEVLLELTIAAWHLMEKNKAVLLQKDDYPDVKVNIIKAKLPFYFECKNITSENADYLQKNVEDKLIKANDQLKNVLEPNYGVVVLNITKPIKLMRVNSDEYPNNVNCVIKYIRKLLTDTYLTHISSVILIWDDFMELDNLSNRSLIAYRRRSEKIDQPSKRTSLQIPRDIDLFKGFTSEFSISLTPRT